MKAKDIIIIILFWLAGIVAGTQFAKFSVTIELIQIATGINELYVGWLLSSLGVIGIIFGATSGVITGRYSPIKIVIYSLFGAGLCSIFQAVLPQPNIMIIIRLLEGITQLLIVSASPTAMLIYTQKKYQSLVMAVWGTFFWSFLSYYKYYKTSTYRTCWLARYILCTC